MARTTSPLLAMLTCVATLPPFAAWLAMRVLHLHLGIAPVIWMWWSVAGIALGIGGGIWLGIHGSRWWLLMILPAILDVDVLFLTAIASSITGH